MVPLPGLLRDVRAGRTGGCTYFTLFCEGRVYRLSCGVIFRVLPRVLKGCLGPDTACEHKWSDSRRL